MPGVIGAMRVVHPAPTAAVVSLSVALAGILAAQAGLPPFGVRTWLTALSVLGSQVLTGAVNDWADRERDRIAQPDKPIPRGQITPRGALAVAALGGVMLVAGAAPLGAVPLALGLVASASAFAYNVALASTPWSVAPYLVSFGVLPLWIASGVGVPLERVAAAPAIVAPFAAAAHLANTVRDFDADRAMGRRNLSQVLGRATSRWVAWGLAVGVGIAVGVALVVGGGLAAPTVALGVIGLVAVGQGYTSAERLWVGMLVAAVAWTAAWAIATG